VPKLTYCWKLNFGLGNSLSQNYLIASSFVVLAAGLGGLNGAFGVMAGMFCVLLWQNARLSSQINQTRCEAEQKLRELEHHFYQVFDQAPFIVQRYAPDGTLRQTNQAWEEVWSSSRNVLVGYNVLQDKQAIASGHFLDLQRAFAGDTVTLSPIFYDPALNGHDGRCRWLEGAAYAIKNDVGEVQEVILVTKDVTDRQQSEAALQQQAIVISVQQEIARKSLKKDEAMRLIVDRVQELTHAAGSVIEMMEGDELVYCEASGAAAAYVGLRLKVAASLSG
jgi:PAS domain S-box-containing protein